MRLLKRFTSIQNFGTTRLEAYSDGVFAIVATLLVIELHIPEVHSSTTLAEGLKELLPKFISFGVSFIYISIYWINHHQLFHLIKKTTRSLFWLNSLFLLSLTFIPFPTALIGSYPQEKTAVIFYGLAMMATAVSFVGMKAYAFSGALVESKHKTPVFYLVAGPLLYLVAVGLAYVNTDFSLLIYLIIPVLYFFATSIDDAK